jgi:hypothetical protein
MLILPGPCFLGTLSLSLFLSLGLLELVPSGPVPQDKAEAEAILLPD